MISINTAQKIKLKTSDVESDYESIDPQDIAERMAKAIEDHGPENPEYAIEIFKKSALQKLKEIKDTKPDLDPVRELNFAYVQAQLIPALLTRFENTEFAYHLATASEAALDTALAEKGPESRTALFYAKIRS